MRVLRIMDKSFREIGEVAWMSFIWAMPSVPSWCASFVANCKAFRNWNTITAQLKIHTSTAYTGIWLYGLWSIKWEWVLTASATPPTAMITTIIFAPNQESHQENVFQGESCNIMIIWSRRCAKGVNYLASNHLQTEELHKTCMKACCKKLWAKFWFRSE